MNPDRRLRFKGLASLTAGGPPPPAPRCPEGLPGRQQASGNSACLNPASPQEVHPAPSPPRLLPVTGGPKLAAGLLLWLHQRAACPQLWGPDAPPSCSCGPSQSGHSGDLFGELSIPTPSPSPVCKPFWEDIWSTTSQAAQSGGARMRAPCPRDLTSHFPALCSADRFKPVLYVQDPCVCQGFLPGVWSYGRGAQTCCC